MCVPRYFSDPPAYCSHRNSGVVFKIITQTISQTFRSDRRAVQWLRIASLGIKNSQEIAAQHFERSNARAALKFRNGQKRRLLAQAFNIGARDSIHEASKLIEVDVGRERHTLATELHNGRTI